MPVLIRSQSTPGFRPGVVVLGLLLLLGGAGLTHADSCASSAPLRSARVDHVIDGDTVALADGRDVRLIGINAPETSHGDKPGEPMGQVAKAALARLLPRGASVYLQPGVEDRDHYGRLLAHLFLRESGGSVEESLLRQGLAQRIAIPPNLELADCLRNAEREALTGRRGIWSESYFAPRNARELSSADAGYRRVRLKVTAIHTDRRGWWLDTDGPLALRVLQRDAARFPAPPNAWVGRQLIVRGWIKDRSSDYRAKRHGYAPMLLPLQHPDMIESGL